MQKKARWIIGGSVVGACVVVAIVVPCVLLIPDDDSPPTEPTNEPPTEPPEGKPTYTFEDLYDTTGKFSHSSLYPNWDKIDEDKTKFITRNDKSEIVLRDVTKPDDDISVIINEVGDGKTTSYSVSADKEFVFYRDDYKKVWRHSYTGSYTIWKVDGTNKAGTKVTTIVDFPTDAKFHHMEWSPTDHKLAFVYEWNVWVIDDLEAENPVAKQVTTDGQQNVIYNGIPDWVYEEEMISANNVLYWAPDSSRFAFLKTDDTNTQHVKFSKYNDAQYPETVDIAYPKAGTTNPTVALWVYDITEATTKQMAPGNKVGAATPTTWPSNGNFTNYYFSRLTWLDGDTCFVTWIDRPQTESVGNKCKRDTANGNWACEWGDGSTEYVGNGWVGSFGPFNIVWKDDDTQHFTIYARPNDGDDTNGYWQIVKVDWTNQASKTWVTKTNYDIVGLYFYDNATDWLYFTAAWPEPRHRHVLRVKGSGTNIADPECMTCDLDKDFETRCGWVTPSFNGDKSVAVVNCRGWWIPMTVYYTIGTDGAWSEKPMVLYDNNKLLTTVGEMKWPKKEYGTFPSSKYPDKAYNYEIFKPADFDESKKYPLLIEVYAGPEFQSVNDIWTKGWATTHMVSDKDIIVASVDGRGSAYEGYKFMREAYKQLGQKEPEDQTDFAAWLAAKDWIDETKVGLWGWSYGGYTTSHSIGYDGGNTFKCGIAVAPLADWRWYDSMYAERYMGLPQENDEAYTNASIIEAHDLNNFKKAEYTLIHGTADDNVHFQSAAEMEKALVEADVDFDDFFYADEDHSIRVGANANKHVYRQLTTRMGHCLDRCPLPYPGKC